MRLPESEVAPRVKSRINNYYIANTGCWIHMGGTNNKGYVQLGVGNRTKYLAHRLSFALHKGAIPEGMLVLHTCDRPSCINPDHLVLGSQKDNMKDCASKGRLDRQKG